MSVVSQVRARLAARRQGLRSVGLLWLLVALFVSEAVNAEVSTAHTLTDDSGATLSLAAPAKRIVSLSPGATEMLFAAGAGARIVATVRGADEPAAARAIERIGDVNALQYKRLQALQPDVIVVWKDLVNRLVRESLEKIGVPIYYVSVSRFEDIPDSVRRLGKLAGTQAQAEPRARAMAARVAALPPIERLRFSVFYMMWDIPLYTVGSRHLLNDAIRRCGGRNIFDDIDFPAPIVEFKNIRSGNPDVILMATTPITARDWRERWAAYPEVRAVAERRFVTYTDPRLTRMGPSMIDAVEPLCRQLASVAP